MSDDTDMTVMVNLIQQYSRPNHSVYFVKVFYTSDMSLIRK